MTQTSYQRSLLQALEAERAARSPAGSGAPWDPLEALSPQQAKRFLHPARFKANPAGRRSGKTNLLEKVLLTSRDHPGQQSFYVSTSKTRAVATIWDELVLMNDDLGLGGAPNLTTHTMRFPGRGMFTVTGVEDKVMANDLRGRPKVWCWLIDEAQDWKDDLLRYFYEQVVFPSLADVRGEVWMSGTGGPPDGFWYEVATQLPEWERFDEWTPLDNPFLAEGEAAALIKKACEDRGVDINDPSIQREFFARFLIDTVRQIFPYDDEKNGFNRGTWDVATGWWKGGDLPAGDYSVVISNDYGSVDAAAWTAWGFTPSSPHLYLLETDEQDTLGSSGQTALTRTALEKYGRRVVNISGDPGGGGKGVIIDLRQEHWLPVEPALKADKAAGCISLRGGLRSGRVKIAREERANLNRKGRHFLQDLQKPEWDPNAVGTVIKGHFPDKVDAALYGYRKAAALHHFSPPPPPKPTWIDQDDERILAEQEATEGILRDLGFQ